MLKKTIKYTDFNGEEQEDIEYFNLTKTELIELEVNYEGGLAGFAQRIIDTKDRKVLVEEFKRLILLAYGRKSEDGKRFVKSEAMREEFSQSAAFDALFTEFAENDDSAAVFFNGIVPKDMAEQVAKAAAEQGIALPPPPPVSA